MTFDLGKIDYYGRGKKTNRAEVEIGFRFLKGNDECYFTITGQIWNARKTDILRGGVGTPQFLLEEFFPNDPVLMEIVNLSKWHFTDFSKIPARVRTQIIELMEGIEDFNGDLRNL